MITWNANPIAFSAGPIEVRWYGLVYAIGFLIAYFVLRAAAKKNLIRNLTEKNAEDYILWLMLGSILGSRLIYVLVYNPGFYFSHLLEIPAVWHGGLSIHGGLLGAAVATIIFCKKNKTSFYAIADILVLPLAFVLIFGRLANYANAELYGRITNVAWCVTFPGADSCRHPSQLYEALYSYILFITLLIVQEFKTLKKGTLFWLFITLYGAFRFMTTFYREFDPTDPAILGLSIGQWLSLTMVIAGIIWFMQKNVTEKNTNTPHNKK